MPYIHKQLAAGRWFTLSLAEQLANVGSDVERAIHAAGDSDRKERAVARALELLDLTLKDPRRAGDRSELLRLRETLCAVFQEKNASATSLKWLSDYFLEWGLKARAGR